MNNNRKNRKKWKLKARNYFKQLITSSEITKFKIPSSWSFDVWPWETDEDDNIIYRRLPIISVKCWLPNGDVTEMEYMPFMPEGFE
jgi:hypothetical protein